LLTAFSLTRLIACSCVGPSSTCNAAGSSAAVFTGTLVGIADPLPSAPGAFAGEPRTARRVGGFRAPAPRPLRTIRIQVGQALSGIAPGQKEVEIATGMGGGDCGYPFQAGADYVVYAYQNAEGRLETGICSRTRPTAQAAEDLQYFRLKANAPETGQIRVLTHAGASVGKPGISIAAEKDGVRYHSVTNAAGDALFTNLAPGAYTIHDEMYGDFPEVPAVHLYAKGCLDVTFLRSLRIQGRVTTNTGEPAARIEVQLRSAENAPGDGAMTGPDGRYQMRIVRSGEYYLGVNLNRTPTTDTPYPRWYYPGTGDPASAIKIEFSGRPEFRTYDFVLPDRQPDRIIQGVVLKGDGQPMSRAVLSALDAAQTFVAQATSDPTGRFSLRVFAGVPYRLHAVGFAGAGMPVSAIPFDIEPGSNALSLRLNLTEPGNLLMDERQRRPNDRDSIEQVLAPLVVALAEKPHQMAAGVQTERPRRARQPHARLFRSAVAFAVIAGMAAGDQILPSRFAGARSRHHMIQRQLGGVERLQAILASVTVAHQDVLARQRASLMRNAAVFEQADHAGHSQSVTGRVNVAARMLLGRGNPLQHQHQRAARRAHVDRLIAGVEHQHRTVQPFLTLHDHCFKLPELAAMAFSGPATPANRSRRANASNAT